MTVCRIFPGKPFIKQQHALVVLEDTDIRVKNKPPEASQDLHGAHPRCEPGFWLRGKVMVEASGRRGLSLGKGRTSTDGLGWTRGSSGGRERGPFSYPLSPARDPRAQSWEAPE